VTYPFDAAAVKSPEHFRELGEGKANLGSGTEMGESEINCVGAGFDGRMELGPMTSGTHYFWLDAVHNLPAAQGPLFVISVRP